MAKRYGRTKQLLKLGGKFLLEWVLEAALASRLAGVVLVLGHEQEQIQQKLGSGAGRSRLQIIVNDRYREGQAYSLRAGLSAVQQQFCSAMFLLGDQPRVQTATIDYLLNCFGKSQKSICVPVYRRIRGNPTIFDRSMYGKLMAIEGDVGARNVIREHPQRVLTVEVDDPECVRDIDVPSDFEAFQKDPRL
jgi:molybdenum cofactor cytidylyltransferase